MLRKARRQRAQRCQRLLWRNFDAFVQRAHHQRSGADRLRVAQQRVGFGQQRLIDAVKGIERVNSHYVDIVFRYQLARLLRAQVVAHLSARHVVTQLHLVQAQALNQLEKGF